MRILFVADGRSPIALNWMDYFVQAGDNVHLASTYPCQPKSGFASLNIIPVAMSGIYGQSEVRSGAGGRLLRKILPVSVRTQIRQILAPSSFPGAVNTLRTVIERVQPELVHAMRIPYEGIIASSALEPGSTTSKIGHTPLVVSVWGNDFTFHARSSSKMAAYTRQTLSACNGLHTDCMRDMHLARDLGFSSKKPGVILPAGGGIKLDTFFPARQDANGFAPPGQNSAVTIINPRGFRAYVRNDTFFNAIPLVLKAYPLARFLCPGMETESQAQKWVRKLSISEHVDLLPSQSYLDMAELFRKSQVSLSITTHDGTPNTLLEAMACGCFPIAGDIESLREWITPGVNGLLVDPADPHLLAEAMIKAISDTAMRINAAEHNLRLVRERAEYFRTMRTASEFYRQFIRN